MRRSTLLVPALALVIAAVTGPPAPADVSPGLTVSLPLNSPLGSVLRAEARNGEPDRPYDATVDAILKVGRTRIADIGRTFVPAPANSSAVLFAVPRSARARARREAARTGHRRATVTFVIRARDTVTGEVQPIFVEHSYVRLGPGTHAKGPTRVAIVAEGIQGSEGKLLDGDAFISTPRRWLRTSTPGARTATFGPVAVTPDCRATVVVWPLALAARTPLADRTASQRRDPARASFASAITYLGDPWTEAIGVQRFARYRYAGVRINVDFEPGCPASAAHATTLLAPLRNIVRTVRVHVRRVRQAPMPNA